MFWHHSLKSYAFHTHFVILIFFTIFLMQLQITDRVLFFFLILGDTTLAYKNTVQGMYLFLFCMFCVHIVP